MAKKGELQSYIILKTSKLYCHKTPTFCYVGVLWVDKPYRKLCRYKLVAIQLIIAKKCNCITPYNAVPLR